LTCKSAYVAGTLQGPVSGLKTYPLQNGTIAVTVTAQATPSGCLFNPVEKQKKLSSARIYTSLFVRHWDSYVTPNKNSIFYATLRKVGGKYAVTKPGFVNALKHSGLESPVPPFGGTDHYDISKSGIVFVAKDPALIQANYTKSDLYFIPLSTFQEPDAPKPRKIETPELEGASSSPTFSPDGRKVAFLRMKNIAYESDKNRLVIVTDVRNSSSAIEMLASEDGKGVWPLSPSSVSWSRDGNQLHLVAEDTGRGRLFKLSLLGPSIGNLPEPIVMNGYVTDIRPLASDDRRLFISSTSLIDNSIYSIVDPESPSKSRMVSSNSKNGLSFGLSQSQISEIWFKGEGDYRVHAWVIKPSSFDDSKTYPLAYLIHGGPQGAWGESWSTRWNPAVFAEQGYVVVAPNPTGSTGYGQDFVDGITNQWGGRPYNDLVNGFEYIENNMSYVDTDRAVALGASYGGYMINWIQGHDFGRKFKALETHDGVFSTLNQYSSEELWFTHHDFAGTLWDHRENYERWDPARFTENWQTPHLIIHNELDYRLPIGEGLAAFNVLQTRKVESKFLSFPDENHWVQKPENSLVWHEQVLGWINKYSRVNEMSQRSWKASSNDVKL
jgi:dipeptidyl aminopeptidase/acylaminoacyl peptidase